MFVCFVVVVWRLCHVVLSHCELKQAHRTWDKRCSLSVCVECVCVCVCVCVCLCVWVCVCGLPSKSGDQDAHHQGSDEPPAGKDGHSEGVHEGEGLLI